MWKSLGYIVVWKWTIFYHHSTNEAKICVLFQCVVSYHWTCAWCTGFKLSKLQDCGVLHDEAEPSRDSVDCALQEEAQEGSRGRSQKEKNTANCQISESCSRSNTGDHIGQEKPKARGPEGTERATDKVWIWGAHTHTCTHIHTHTHTHTHNVHTR